MEICYHEYQERPDILFSISYKLKNKNTLQ